MAPGAGCRHPAVASGPPGWSTPPACGPCVSPRCRVLCATATRSWPHHADMTLRLPARAVDVLDRRDHLRQGGSAAPARTDYLPAEYADALRALQDDVAAFPAQQARAVVAAELRRPVAELSARFEGAPFAAGSLSQVHRAELPDGTAVASRCNARRPVHLAGPHHRADRRDPARAAPRAAARRAGGRPAPRDRRPGGAAPGVRVRPVPRRPAPRNLLLLDGDRAQPSRVRSRGCCPRGVDRPDAAPRRPAPSARAGTPADGHPAGHRPRPAMVRARSGLPGVAPRAARPACAPA